MLCFIPSLTVTTAGNVPTGFHEQLYSYNILLLHYIIYKKPIDGIKILQDIFRNRWTLRIKYSLSSV